jgi:chromosomal replication initiation ATPase DnaA
MTRPGDASRVLSLTADYYRVTTADVLGQAKTPPTLVEARKVCYRLLHDMCRLSWPAVGVVMGKDHKTVMHGARNCDQEAARVLTRLLTDGL